MPAAVIIKILLNVPSPNSTPEAYYSARKNNLDNSAGYYYTGKQGLSDVVTYMELKEIDLGL
jgi:hypothetical protein